MKKPCRLVLLKRKVANPDMMTQGCPQEYWAGRNAPGGEWVAIKSNAALLNKSDAKRDLLENPQFVENNQIYYCGVYHETEFELVELIEKKSFGFLLKRLSLTEPLTEEFITKVHFDIEDEMPTYFWGNKNEAMIFTALQKDNNLEYLGKAYPNQQFGYQELFTE